MRSAPILSGRLLQRGRLRCRAALRRDECGAALPEFAILAPVFLLLLFGLFDLGQYSYARSILAGAVQQAARSSSLETGDPLAADALLAQKVRTVAPGAEIRPVRASYVDFADVGRPERWNDINGDGRCNNGETYVDENGDGRWGGEIGDLDNGGANDVVVYTVEVTYRPLFGAPFIPGGTSDRIMTASTVTKNQPYADQARYGSTAGSCK